MKNQNVFLDVLKRKLLFQNGIFTGICKKDSMNISLILCSQFILAKVICAVHFSLVL